MSGALVLSAAVVGVRAHDRITTKVTWDREVGRIVQARCASCHVEGGRAPMPLVTYAQARPWAKAIREEVLARRMPKWHAARGYGDFANDPSLSPFEVALIAAWADGGAPKGLPPAGDGAAATSSLPPSAPATATSGAPGITREVTLPCGDQPLTGRLVAVRPMLSKGSDALIEARPAGHVREIVAWIRGFDPAFTTTYHLRTPIDLPVGSRLRVEPTGACSIVVTVAKAPKP